MSVDTLRWTLAIMISVLGHVFFFLEGGASPRTGDVPVAAEKITRVQFRNTLSVAPARDQTPAEPKKAVAERGNKKTVAPRPAEVEPKVAQASQPQEAAASPEQDAVAIPSPSASTVADAAGAQGLIAARVRYARVLAAHIERYKYYPDSARRRGIVGGVRVGFIVSADGGAAAIECDQGPGMLNAAACEAVRKAMPLPLPPAEMTLPMPVSFVMEFALK